MYTLNGRTARLAVSAGLCALISMGGAAPSASALNYNEIQGISTWDAATDNSAKGSGTANGGFADGGATEGGSSEGGSTDGSEQTDPGEQAVVQVGDTTYSDLNKALSNAEDGDTIKLLADTSYATGRIDGISVTLDLNGKTLTVDNRAFNIVNSGSLTLDDGSAEGSGLLKVNKVGSTLSLGMVLGSGGSFTMKGGTLEVPEYGAYITNGANGDKIIMSGGKVKADYGLCAVGNGSEHSASIVIEGGLVESSIFGVVTNGGSNVGGVDIVMTNGTVRSTAEDAPAMYLPAFNSTAKISGGVIEGGTGIEIRAGDLTVFGSAQITGTGPLKTEPNGSGSTSSGAGIAIKQHATKQPINVLIEGSPTISGAHAVDESNPQKNDEESIAKVSVNINGGSFSSTAEGEPAIFSEDCKNFISGGSFSTKVESDLLSTSVKAELNASGTYTYFDSVDKAVAEAEKTGGEVIQLGEENTVKVTLNYGYSDKTLVLNAVSGTKLPAPSRSGYTFLGWYDGESKVDVVPNTDANLEARWYYNAPIVPPTPSDKTEVEHNQDGSTTTTVTKPDGSQTITHETATGTESVVKKDEDGNVISTEVTVSKKDAESGKVELPLADAEPAVDVDKAPEVEVKVPSSVTAEKPVQVTVPVAKGDGSEPNYGVVVFAVDEDGNETLIPKTAVDDDGNVIFEVSGDVTIKVVDNARDMPDVTDADWFAGDVVDFATARGIVNGVALPDGSRVFDGYGRTSRGMFVAMLHNLELNPEAASEGSLPDVPEGAFYADAAAWALEEGILSGVDMADGSKQFQGETAVTREQVAVFLMRYAEALGMDVSARADIDFPDAGEVSGFAKEAMSWAVAEGLFTGDDVTGELNPTDDAARAEVAAVLMRFINLMYA